MLSAPRTASSSVDSGASSSAATPLLMTDPPREERLSAWEALVAAKKSTAAPPSPASATSFDRDVLPSARAATAPSTAIPHHTAASAASAATAALSFLRSSAPYRPPAVTPTDEPAECRLSGLRIKDRRQSQSEMERQLARCKVVKMDALRQWQAAMEAKGKDGLQLDWLVFGIIAMKSDIRSSSRGEKYLIVTLCDLRGHLLSCFLFGPAFQQHYSENVGSVIAVANAKLLNNDSPSHSSTSSHAFLSVSLSVSQPSQLLVLGTSFDFALCASYRREQLSAGGPSSSSLLHCKNIVDLRKGKYCDHHVREEYKRIAGARPGINKAVAGELSGLIRFGDKRLPRSGSTSRASGMSGSTKLRLGTADGVGLGSFDWASTAASTGSVFMMPPLKSAGKTAAIATTAKPLPALRPSAVSARMLAMIQAENNKARPMTAAAATTASMTALPVLSVPPPSTPAPARPILPTRPTRSSPSTPASVAQLRANRASAALTATTPLTTRAQRVRSPSSTTTAGPNSTSPLSDNPFAAVQKPKPMSREEATQQLRRLQALTALAKHGPVAAPDPNSSHTDEQHVARATASRKRPSERDAIQVSLTADGQMSVRHLPPSSAATEAASLPAPSSPGRAAKRARLEALFGEMDESSARFQQLVSASSAHVELLADMKQDEREQYWQWLEAKEQLQQQMQAIREQQVEVWVCTDCNGRRSLHFPVLCKESGHQLDKRPATKRFFECGQCSSRVTTIDSALPLHCCHKCGASQWKASGMISERAGLAASVRSELQHKSEETWLRSSSGVDGSMRNDDPNNTRSGARW